MLRSALFLVVAAAAPAAPPMAVADDGQAFIVLPNEPRRYRGQQGRGNDIAEILASKEQTGGKLGIWRQTVVPGSAPPLHLHTMEAEWAYVVSGEFKFQLRDRVVLTPAGSFVHIPHMTPHAFKNVGTTPGVLLFGMAPGGFEKMFADREGVDKATNDKLLKQYHVQIVGPPIP